MRILRIGVLAFLLVSWLEAAPPAVTHLFPAGGERAKTVEVLVGGTFDTWPVEVWSSHPGVRATAHKDRGKLTLKIAADAEPGIAWLRLADASGASGLRPFVVGTLPEIEEKEPNDDPSRAQKIEPTAVVVNARLAKAGDVDCYAVTLRKGQAVTASLLANRTLKSPMDGVLQILNADGFVLTQSHDVFDLDPHLSFPAPRDGTYLVRVFAFPAVADSSIRFAGAETFVYRLTLSTGPFVEHAWPLAVSRDEPGSVALVGANLPDGAKAEVKGDGPMTIVSHPDAAGAASVRLERHRCALVDGKDQVVPCTISGKIEQAGQGVSLSVVGIKGKPILVQIETASVGSSLTPLLRVLDASGKQITRTEATAPGKEIEITHTPAQDGPFRIEVSDLYRAALSRGWFRLRLTPPEPDFALTVPADRLTLVPGKPTDVTVTVVRRNGFSGDIALSAEGLPAGIIAMTVAPAKADGKSLVLRLSAEKGEVRGAFRIVGKGIGIETGRFAEAAQMELGLPTPYLWLTVSGAK